MSDLTISDEAVRAVYASPYADSLTNKGIRSTLELGAPLIVAAELRRLADHYEPEVDVEDNDDNEEQQREALRRMCKGLRTRAAELDPEGGAR